MKLRLICLFALVMALSVSMVMAQGSGTPRSYVMLHLTNASQPEVINTFGVAVGATKCTNSVDSALGETELPPPNPAPVLDARLQQASGCTGAEGGMAIDFYPGSTTLHSSATFKIIFTLYDGTDSSYTLSWDTTGFSARFDTLTLKSSPAAGALASVNMLTSTSVTVTNTDDAYAVSTLNIKMGAKPIFPEGVVEQKNNLPKAFALNQNYPNPFNPTTVIPFSLLKTSVTQIAVYNVLGQKVTTLVNQQMAPGTYTATWNGKDDRGVNVSSGVYFVRMIANTENSLANGNFTSLRKILLMK